MRRVGVHATSIDITCSNNKPCESVYENTRVLAQHIDAKNACVVAEFVRDTFKGDVPIDTTDTALDRMLKSAAFQCPELHIDVYQPCTVRSCAFWTPNQWTRNCMLAYRVEHARDTLDLRELSFLLDESVSSIRTQMSHAVADARKWALVTKIEREEKPELVVGGEAAAELPELSTIRAKFGLSPRRVVKIALESFATLKSAAQALGIAPEKFKAICEFFALPANHLD
jgi:hypothetical protein